MYYCWYHDGPMPYPDLVHAPNFGLATKMVMNSIELALAIGSHVLQ